MRVRGQERVAVLSELRPLCLLRAIESAVVAIRNLAGLALLLLWRLVALIKGGVRPAWAAGRRHAGRSRVGHVRRLVWILWRREEWRTDGRVRGAAAPGQHPGVGAEMVQVCLELYLLTEEQLLAKLQGRRRLQAHEGGMLLHQLLLLPLSELHPLLEE